MVVVMLLFSVWGAIVGLGAITNGALSQFGWVIGAILGLGIGFACVWLLEAALNVVKKVSVAIHNRLQR